MDEPNLTQVTMPQMGESLTEGTLARWLKAPGAAVTLDEPLCEITTDKVDTELPAPCAGVLRQIVRPEGTVVPVGGLIALIEPLVGEPAIHFKGSGAHAPVTLERRNAPVDQQPAAGRGRSFSPAVLASARRGGVPLDTLVDVPGSGRGGRITKQDVRRHLEGAAAGGGDATNRAAPTTDGEVPREFAYTPVPQDEIVPMSPIQRQVARRMSWTTRISPHVTSFTECDMSQAAAWIARDRDRVANEVGAPLTYTVIVAHVLTRVLAAFPKLNASIVGDALALKPYVKLAIAVAVGDNDDLVVPVVQHADELSLAGLARTTADLAERARTRQFQPADLERGTFTLTNPGVFGGTGGTPLILQPQVAILAMTAIVKRAVVIDDAIAIRPMMTLALSHDHRAANGMTAFRFLAKMREALELGLGRGDPGAR